eukprot:TRINITY_DN2928_c1_g1::TRINITY_DN2928_c1_g1_i20::g.4215::m.4215 TRINITY_DN2928_c1_g1::TRINITY_DN2928_c1_g1_i20::g.4215  ORF type:complete len:109 (-),score=-9.89,DUF1479/PF07350.7/0.083 TRINITY_DN2928_c1_g1_i20:53-379(-)
MDIPPFYLCQLLYSYTCIHAPCFIFIYVFIQSFQTTVALPSTMCSDHTGCLILYPYIPHYTHYGLLFILFSRNAQKSPSEILRNVQDMHSRRNCQSIELDRGEIESGM